MLHGLLAWFDTVLCSVLHGLLAWFDTVLCTVLHGLLAWFDTVLCTVLQGSMQTKGRKLLGKLGGSREEGSTERGERGVCLSQKE